MLQLGKRTYPLIYSGDHGEKYLPIVKRCKKIKKRNKYADLQGYENG